jgi:NADH-quinone oxidoreductase subunit H
LIAAAIRTLRDQGYPHWTSVLVGASIVVTLALLYLLQRPFSKRVLNKHRRKDQAEVPRFESAFPTPPLPGQPLASATKEASNG